MNTSPLVIAGAAAVILVGGLVIYSNLSTVPDTVFLLASSNIA